MEGVPYLSEEGVNFSTLPIIPAFSFTFRAPVPTLQDQARTGFKGMPKCTAKTKLGTPIPGLHLLGQQLASSKYRRTLHIG